MQFHPLITVNLYVFRSVDFPVCIWVIFLLIYFREKHFMSVIPPLKRGKQNLITGNKVQYIFSIQ